ncbi:MAG: DUF1549 domain-containing protein [Planctomycetota bacterium]
MTAPSRSSSRSPFRGSIFSAAINSLNTSLAICPHRQLLRLGTLILLLAVSHWRLIPQAQAVDLAPADLPVEQAIDFYVHARLAAAGVTPAAPATDAQLLRRTLLDLTGRIPTRAEMFAYRQIADENKRTQLVDRLVGSPGWVRHHVDQFDFFLMNGSGGNLREYLQTALTENRPWNEMFRELLTGRGDDPNQKGALQFLRTRAKDLDKLTNDVSVLFFGVNVSCAQCHDHPLVDEWKQDHFYGMKSFFQRSFENGDFLGERAYGQLEYKTAKGETRPAKLMFLTGQVLDEPPAVEPDEAGKKAEKQQLEELKKNKQPPPAPSYSRRARLVEVAAESPETSFFARAAVNHLWARYFGRGLVAPTDQLHAANTPSHPELLAWLARDFVQHGYDMRRLIRGIVLSQAYARSSHWESGNRPDPELLAVAPLRPLSPLQYGMLLRQASSNPDRFAAELSDDEREKRLQGLEGAARGLAGSFEYPSGPDFQVSIDEALLLSNGERIQKELLRDDNEGLVGKLKTISDVNEALDLAAENIFGRSLTEAERAPLRLYVSTRADRAVDAWRQVVWAMLTSGENRFNH